MDNVLSYHMWVEAIFLNVNKCVLVNKITTISKHTAIC